MIIKSMSRKHASFAQLIDYIEGETKLRSRKYSVFHNTYSRSTDRLKAEFMENSEHLRYRKNGVFLYHEVISITRAHQIEQGDKDENDHQQKTALKQIVEEYLHHRGKHNLAYAVLHEDTEHLHFHIVMSANEAGERDRLRLSKEKFAQIQTNLEAWVLEKHPELEQKAVFHKNQTETERQQRKEKKAHLSKAGEELKRRGGKTSIRDDMQEKLADIFTTATDPRHFADLLEKAGFKLYQRGQQYGVTDRDGKKYRLNKLGLSEAWEKLEAKMMAVLTPETQAKAKSKENQETDTPKQAQDKSADPPEQHQTAKPSNPQTLESTIEAEEKRRLDEITARRAEQAKSQANTRTRNTDRDR
jgi:Relaxase/Mobilisation nuclease domain